MIGGVQVSLTQTIQPKVTVHAQRTRVRSRLYGMLNPIKADLLFAWDACAVLLSGIGCANEFGLAMTDSLFEFACVGAGLAPMMLRARDTRQSPTSWLLHVTKRLPVLLIAILTLATAAGAALPSHWIFAWALSAVASLMLGRLLLVAAESAWRERVAVIGEGTDADALRTHFADGGGGVELIPATRGMYDHAHIDHVVEELTARSRRGELDRIVVAIPAEGAEEIRRICHRLKAVRVDVASTYPILDGGRPLAITQVGNLQLFQLSAASLGGWSELGKMVLDRMLALLILLWTTPILAAIALAIRFDSPGPVLFRQKRHGLNGTEFEVFKFRTMTWQGERVGSGEQQTQRGDKRVTRWC